MSTPIEIVTSYLRTFSRNDPDALAAHVSEGFRNDHNSELGSGCMGRNEYRRRLPHFLAEFQDRTYMIDDIVSQTRESCTEVVVRYRFQATYQGAMVDIPGVMWFSVRDELITRRIDTWDSMTFLNQTGQQLDS